MYYFIYLLSLNLPNEVTKLMLITVVDNDMGANMTSVDHVPTKKHDKNLNRMTKKNA